MNKERTLRRSKSFSQMYFCLIVAPLCCTLSGWTQRVAFLYAFLTPADVIRSVRGTGCQPLSEPSICQEEKDLHDWTDM